MHEYISSIGMNLNSTIFKGPVVLSDIEVAELSLKAIDARKRKGYHGMSKHGRSPEEMARDCFQGDYAEEVFSYITGAPLNNLSTRNFKADAYPKYGPTEIKSITSSDKLIGNIKTQEFINKYGPNLKQEAEYLALVFVSDDLKTIYIHHKIPFSFLQNILIPSHKKPLTCYFWLNDLSKKFLESSKPESIM